ncbi:MAG: hypothetical protein J1F13_05050 [Prevotellaceae bacterium]|nr:hypothetical protein [Prevotellaceae bacterium]
MKHFRLFAAVACAAVVCCSCIVVNKAYYYSDDAGKYVKASKNKTIVADTTADERLHYDSGSIVFVEPTLVKEEDNYDSYDYNTWACYKPVFYVMPPEPMNSRADKYAFWCTPEFTYVVEMNRLHWDKMYFQSTSTSYIRDVKTGKKYYPNRHIGAPLDHSYWVEGKAGKWVASVYIFPPLPPTCTVVDIGDDKTLETVPGTTGWANPPVIKNVRVSDLQANQKMKFRVYSANADLGEEIK